ncbi:LruC domain-containing protein [Bacteroides helcogenes]|uniref:DUF4842 domain-containing protein n=1 Tax=Bacteroides helcogenes (strain ATCC 35417 / DSM 20613 / JCM 6297 / CCUG 15421 / P 36-108) TaxID=693979 RepID=E6SNW1_BACT6|nr:LruC domain-containing protein [Bacteroides helcogenes]ADV42779.1 hypothetical protein Bache_0757 [Bacteroides helcogenes P 36-108]MDY5239611.1 LruC domain-containing protein [Bacteroides helcogenes]
MKSKLVFSALLALASLSGCMKQEIYQGSKEETKEYNDFDFSTVAQPTSLNVSYLNTGVQTNVYFELYDEMPVTVGEYSYSKRDDVTPLFSAYTDDKGIYTGTVELPSYLKKVYIYSPAFYAQTLIEAEVTGSSIKATDATTVTTRTVASTNADFHSYMDNGWNPQWGSRASAYNDGNWKTWLGGYNSKKNGEVQYKYTGAEMTITDNSLYSIHSAVINVSQNCPEKFRSSKDMLVSEDAEAAVTFLGQNTCWNCSLGYYYYTDGNAPKSLNDVNVIMLFPNTQDGHWSNDLKASAPKAGIDRGTAVQLMYYPHKDSKDGATTVFPAGTRIGFVLATNAWSNRTSTFTGNKKYRAATTPGLSVNDQGKSYETPRTAIFKTGGYTLVSFEDYTTDQNFSDVVITMKSNPVQAITDIPEVDNTHTTTSEYQGIYAFEDLWPSQGDYDMNDVMVSYTYGKEIDQLNLVYKEVFTFKTFQNRAAYDNGVGVRLLNGGTPANIKYEMRKKGETEFTETTSILYEESEKIFLLTDNVKAYPNTEYRVTLTYNTPIHTDNVSKANVFIYRNETSGKRWEMHLPQEAPTSKVNMDYFSISDDCSAPSKNIYYVRKGNYPFAIFLAGATEADLAKLLDTRNETTHIDVLYDGYNDWVKSNGTNNTDWYKK